MVCSFRNMQESLFYNSKDLQIYDYGKLGYVKYYHSFFNITDSKNLFMLLLTTIRWQQDKINIMGKLIDIPRLTAWYGINDKSYTYSRIKMNPYRLTADLEFIKDKIETVTSSNFNSVLLNQYRNGNDSVDWHSDDEKELDISSDIASVSFGVKRDFQIKPKEKGAKLENIPLRNGSLLIMSSPFQKNFIHRIPKRKKVLKPRINLTFRVIK